MENIICDLVVHEQLAKLAQSRRVWCLFGGEVELHEGAEGIAVVDCVFHHGV
jgi:hypothetical protein